MPAAATFGTGSVEHERKAAFDRAQALVQKYNFESDFNYNEQLTWMFREHALLVALELGCTRDFALSLLARYEIDLSTELQVEKRHCRKLGSLSLSLLSDRFPMLDCCEIRR